MDQVVPVTQELAAVSPPVAARPASRPRIATLDAFRALAIIPVVLYHFLARWTPPVSTDNVYLYGESHAVWFSLGGYGVEFFFIISGAVIFMTLHRCRTVFEFWYRRFARLYPALIVSMAITLAITSVIGQD